MSEAVQLPQLETVLHQGNLTSEEQDDLLIASLLGGLEDLATQHAEQAMADEEIMQRAMGVVDAGSEHFSPESAQFLSLVEQTGRVLEQLGCAHDHFMEMIGKRVEAVQRVGYDSDGTHDHAHEEKHTGAKSEKKKERMRAKKRGWITWKGIGGLLSSQLFSFGKPKK